MEEKVEKILNVEWKKIRILVETLSNANLTEETLNGVYNYLDLLAEPIRFPPSGYMHHSIAINDRAKALERKLDEIAVPKDLKQILREEIGILKYDKEMGLSPLKAAEIALEYNLNDRRFQESIEEQKLSLEKYPHHYDSKDRKYIIKRLEELIDKRIDKIGKSK